MDKGFQSHSRLPFHADQFFQRQFSGRNHPAYTLFLQKAHPLRSCNRHLGTGMQLHARKMFPAERKDSEILYDNSIQSGFIKRRNIIIKFPEFPFLNECIQGQVNLLSMKMSQLQCFHQLFCGEIIRIGTGIKFVAPQIDGICSCVHDSYKAVPVSCWA